MTSIPDLIESLRNHADATSIDDPFVSELCAKAAAALEAKAEEETPSPSARSAPSFDPLLGSGGLPLEQGNEQ